VSKRLVVEDVLTTIRELTDHLKAIREEISAAVLEQEASSLSNIFLEVKDGAETISRFRTAIDDLRHTLWLYVETAQSRKAGGSEIQHKLLARATEILCALSVTPPLPQTYTDPMGGSFVERLLQFMEVWIEPAVRQQIEASPEASHAANGQP
jgi:hypothetical protein